MPIQIIRQQLKGGDQGAVQTLYWMVKLIQDGLADPYVLQTAYDITFSYDKLEVEKQLFAILDYFHGFTRWRSDPSFTELIFDVPGILKRKGGDCEELAMAAATLLLAGGFQPELVLFSVRQDRELHHVIVRFPFNGEFMYYDPGNPEIPDAIPAKITRAWAIAPVLDINGKIILEDITSQVNERTQLSYIPRGIGSLGNLSLTPSLRKRVEARMALKAAETLGRQQEVRNTAMLIASRNGVGSLGKLTDAWLARGDAKLIKAFKNEIDALGKIINDNRTKVQDSAGFLSDLTDLRNALNVLDVTLPQGSNWNPLDKTVDENKDKIRAEIRTPLYDLVGDLSEDLFEVRLSTFDDLKELLGISEESDSLDVDSLAAQAKDLSQYIEQEKTKGNPPATSIQSYKPGAGGYSSGKSNTMTYALIGGGVLVGLGVVYFLARR